MWDTSNDYRLKVTEKSVEMFLKIVEGATLRGKWNKKVAIATAKNMVPEIQTLYYSYLSPQEMADTPQIRAMEDSAHQIMEALGGAEWHRQFMEQANREEKEKVVEILAQIKFFLYTVNGLKNRLELGEINDPIIGIDIKKGEILSVSRHPRADQLLVCNVNLLERVITVITNDLAVREGNQVAVALLPPVTFQGITSQGMFLGTEKGVLKELEGEMGDIPHGIPLKAFNEARNLVEKFLQ